MPTPDLGEGHISALPGATDSAKEGGSDSSSGVNSSDSDGSSSSSGGGTKRVSIEQSQSQSPGSSSSSGSSSGNGDDSRGDSASERDTSKRRRNTYEVVAHPPTNAMVARPMGGMKGHTAFLTFAICPEKSS
jgi:hypothetical protein